MQQFTLYLFGGSVPWGFPYAPKCDIGSIVAQAWSGAVAGAELVVCNEAQYGAPSRYVLERARSVAQRSHAPGSAVALIWSGNNEFIHLAPPRERHGRGPALIDAAQRQAIVERHRLHLEASIIELRAAGIEVVLSTIPINMRDWPPSYAVRDEARGPTIDAMCSRARDLQLAGRPDEAEALLRDILCVEPECADLHFMLGRLLLAAGRSGEARSYLVRANDCDGRPIRATTAINDNILSLSAAHGTRLLDAERRFQAAAADGICGNAQFWDDCHPKLEGYIQIAEELGMHIAELAGMAAPPPMPSPGGIRRAHAIDPPFLADLLGRVGLYCYKHSDCCEPHMTLEFGETYARDALRLAPDNIEVHIVLMLLLACRGDRDGARTIARSAYAIDPSRALWLLHGREALTKLAALGIRNVERWLA